MAFPPPRLAALAEQVVALLKERKVPSPSPPVPVPRLLTPTSPPHLPQETLSLVETATGGLIGATILSIPGTSAVFAGGVQAYQLRAREELLGWSKDEQGVYDGPTESIVSSLASLCRARLASTYALAESGVAGPGRPDVYRAEIDGPGYCPLAVVGEGLPQEGVRRTVRVEQADGVGRAENMVSFAEKALELLLDVLEAKQAGGAWK
ncbi:hypothetical protein JCM10207_000095 [Rhodosporidiobolus poonsookiae]